MGTTSSKHTLDEHVTAYKANFLYELDNRLMLKWYPHRVSEKMHPGSVLELGIGHGYSTREFAEIATNYTVLEGSKIIIGSFRKNNPDLHYVNIIHTYFEEYKCNQVFDNIIMGFILEHVDNPLDLISKYTKYLSGDGKLFIAVPNSDSMHRRLGCLAGLLDNLETLSDSDRALGHQRYFNLEKIRTMSKECGLKIITEEGLFLKPLTTNQLESLHLSEEIFQAMLELGVNYPELSAGILVELRRK